MKSRANLVFALLYAASAVPLGCADQPEGARCDTNNGDSDCESGLICTPASKLVSGSKVTVQGAAKSTLGFCCPASGAVDPACFLNSSTPGAGGSAGTGGASSGGSDSGTHDGASTGGATGGGPPSSGGSPSDAAADRKG